MHSIATPTDFQWVAIALVSIGSIARLGRLFVHDHWPPVVRIRNVWDHLVPEKRDHAGWNLLLHCHYCLCFWFAAGVVLWGYFTDWNTIWWLVNGSLAAAYLAAILVTYDGDD